MISSWMDPLFCSEAGPERQVSPAVGVLRRSVCSCFLTLLNSCEVRDFSSCSAWGHAARGEGETGCRAGQGGGGERNVLG